MALTYSRIVEGVTESKIFLALLDNVSRAKNIFDSVTPSTILLYVKAIGLFFKM